MIYKLTQSLRARASRPALSKAPDHAAGHSCNLPGHHPASTSDVRPYGRGRGRSMIVLSKPSRRTGGHWVVSLVREVDDVSRTVLSNAFERDDASRANEYAQELFERFPSAYVAGF